MLLGDCLRQSPGAAAKNEFVRFGDILINAFELLYCFGNWFISWSDNFRDRINDVQHTVFCGKSDKFFQSWEALYIWQLEISQ